MGDVVDSISKNTIKLARHYHAGAEYDIYTDQIAFLCKKLDKEQESSKFKV